MLSTTLEVQLIQENSAPKKQIEFAVFFLGRRSLHRSNALESDSLVLLDAPVQFNYVVERESVKLYLL